MYVNRKIEVGPNALTLDKRVVKLGRRIDERRQAIGISQAELARRVGIRQSTVNSLINGDSRSSRSIVAIARVLGTTPAYLSGATDDPDAGAPPPAAEPTLQLITMQVALPTEDALTDGFGAILSVSTQMSRDELARELAKRLPTLLRIAGGAAAVQSSAPPFAPAEEPAAPPRARRARQRA